MSWTTTEMLTEDAEIGNKLDTLGRFYRPGSPAFKAAANVYLARRRVVRKQLEALRQPDGLHARVENILLRGIA